MLSILKVSSVCSEPLREIFEDACRKKNLTQRRKAAKVKRRRQDSRKRAQKEGITTRPGQAAFFTFHVSPLTFHPLPFAPLRLCVRFSLRLSALCLHHHPRNALHLVAGPPTKLLSGFGCVGPTNVQVCGSEQGFINHRVFFPIQPDILESCRYEIT